ncbi:MAG: tetraacyldisaccharide 4'-kinase [Deltaproteobacteria bacterium]|nr:tetraacyldisaccharide 4'-kinase [Deltaproteobacteria bacterium]
MNHLRISEQINLIFNKWMEGEERGFLFYLLVPFLYITSILYGIGVRLRLFLYRIGIFKIKRLNCKVISVGNMTLGGSGKTPVAIFLAEKFKENGKRVVIVSRGYQGRVKNTGIVSDGDNILLTPEDAGDEPYLMALKLKGVPVIVGRDRYKAGMHAIKKFKPDMIILDDGFQHIGLHREINILVVDSRRGFGNGYLFPLGMLREPLNGLKRASMILVKESGVRSLPPQASSGGQKSEKKINVALIEQAKDCPTISFSYKAGAIVNPANGSRMPADVLKGKKVAALSGIADPKSFRNTLERLGAKVAKEIVYPDHHHYTPDDLDDIVERIKGADMVITTEKDAVKLKRLSIESLPIYALEIDLGIEDITMLKRIAGV